MRLALVAAIALGCASHPAPHSSSPSAAAAFPATRWVPARPMYVLASPTFKDAQRSLRDVIGTVGMLGGIEVADVSQVLRRLLAVDALSADAVAAVGIDLEGGIVMFSEALSPTFVVRLAAPDQMLAFLDHQRELGLRSQSVIVDGTEVFTAQLLTDAKVSWAIAGEWMWVHFALPSQPEDGASWFTHSHHPDGGTWEDDWTWARRATGGKASARPAVLGFANVAELLARIRRARGSEACAKLVSPIGRVAVSIDGDGQSLGGAVTVELGAGAPELAAAVLPVPEGWAGATAAVPLSVQWNLDLPVVRAWLQPCAQLVGSGLEWTEAYGVRAARATLLTFDVDEKSGSGALSLDLVHKRWFEARLADLPGGSLRSTFERDRSFGPLPGHSLAIPFGPTIDYVLTDHVGFVAVGDRLLETLIGHGQGARGPIATLDIRPPALAPAAWEWMLERVVGSGSKVLVDSLMRWREGHVAITLEGSSLRMTVSGIRR